MIQNVECNITVLKFGKGGKHACGRCGYHICGNCKKQKGLNFYPFYPENNCINCDQMGIDMEILDEYGQDEQIEYSY
jgi:hypothetical protein